MTEENFRIRNRNPNIVIKGVGFEDLTEKTRELKHLRHQLSKLQNEQKKQWMKRDDYNNTVREQQNKARELREERDILNAKVSSMAKERKEIEAKKEEMITQKRELGMQIDELEDYEEKQRLYQELVKIRQELDEVFERSKEIRETYNDIRHRATEAHQNMLVYRKLEKQSRKEADRYHQQGREIGTEIKKLKREIYQLRKDIR